MPVASNFITLVIVAQGRKEFLKFAIDSAIHQTLDRSSYEIIVVKDFEDQGIEKMIRENGIIGITVDPKSHEKLSRVAVKRSKGNVLCFLDDDDLFREDRLEKVREKFSDPRIGYYHNSVITVDESGSLTDTLSRVQAKIPVIARAGENKERLITEMLKLGSSFNISSIAVKRELAFQFMDYYEKLPLSLDLFLFYGALISDYDIYIDSEKLTYYRVHSSVSNSMGTYDEFKQKREWFLTLFMEDHALITTMVKGTAAEKYILAGLSEVKLRLYIFRQTAEVKPTLKDYMRMLTGRLPGRKLYHFELISTSLFSRIWPEKIRKIIYEKYMKEVGNIVRKKGDAVSESM